MKVLNVAYVQNAEFFKVWEICPCNNNLLSKWEFHNILEQTKERRSEWFESVCPMQNNRKSNKLVECKICKRENERASYEEDGKWCE